MLQLEEDVRAKEVCRSGLVVDIPLLRGKKGKMDVAAIFLNATGKNWVKK